MSPRTDLQTDGDRDLRERLLADPDIRRAIDTLDRKESELGSRRHLLATALRLTEEMAPDLHAITTACRDILGVEGPLELYVYPDAALNAAAVRPERGRFMLMVSSALLESLEPAELRFVAGHEIGHYLFDHHKIPTGYLLRGGLPNVPALALDLFAWQRFAEISADRAGLVCAGSLEPAASALFKLASGLKGGRIKVNIDQFLSQVGDLEAEGAQQERKDDRPHSDWFSTHPFSPLRLKAAQLCMLSEVMLPGGVAREIHETQIYDLMTLMSPSYLQAHTDVAETMRRLLFAGGIAIAAANGQISRKASAALERLLGPGTVPYGLDPARIAAELPSRIESVRQAVPLLRRAQVIRDLSIIARADGQVADAEMKILREIAAAVEVDVSVVTCALDPTAAECRASDAWRMRVTLNATPAEPGPLASADH